LNYILLKDNGTREEVSFLVINGKNYISDHISHYEFGEHDENGNLVPEIQLTIFEPVIELFESIRETVGRPIIINSGYRSLEKQKRLYDRDLKLNDGKPSGKVAKPGNSPHMYGVAMDLSIPSNMNAEQLAALIRKRSVDLKFPMARTGWKQYGGTFVHFDLIPMLFEPYLKGIKNPLPQVYVPGLKW
jgi:uncharacterized protein YcbK (DUF882 family)